MDTFVIAPVSVVIPCHQCASVIKRAIGSVASQTLRPVEVILVDDASGDDTLEILKVIRGFYGSWIRIVELPMNLGAAAARNAGWKIASQPYIAFLDADDSWHPDKLKIQYEYMHANPDIVLCGHQCIWLREGESPPTLLNNSKITRISAISLLFKNAFSTPTVMVKNDIPFRFEEKMRYLEDLRLWQTVAFAKLNISRIECPLAYVHKPFYGVSGLSAQLWKMEKNELQNFSFLYQSGNINIFLYLAASILSVVKFIRRALVTIFMKPYRGI